MIGPSKIVILAVLSLQGLILVNADDKCLDMVQGLMGSQMGTMVPCINELGYKNPKERGQNYNCIMKCVLSKVGTLNEEGQISPMKGITFILANFPNEYIEKALMEISKCMEHASIKVGDPSDTNCIKMRPLIACGTDFIFNICS